MGRGVPAHRTVHESHTNFLKICIFAVARADTKSAKKRMVVRFFKRRRKCVKCGEMGVIVPVVSTTQKDHPTGWSFLRGGNFCVGIDRNVRRSICGTDGPACAPCIAVGAGILYAAPQERRIHSRLRFNGLFNFSYTKVPPAFFLFLFYLAICTAAAASASASDFRRSIASAESGAPESAAAASASAPPLSPATRSGAAQPM